MLPMTGWFLNTFALFATTIGALLMFLHLHRSASAFEGQSAEVKQIYEKHRRQLMVGVGVLAAWLVIQALAVILL
jgi:hypothetical protein